MFHVQFYWWLSSFHSNKNPFVGWLMLIAGMR